MGLAGFICHLPGPQVHVHVTPVFLALTTKMWFITKALRVFSCPVFRSNIYRKVRSFFLLRRNTRRFNNKLIHEDVCFAFNENNYILQATIELFSRWYLSRDQMTSSENISTIVIGPFILKTSTRPPTCKTAHRTPVCSIERLQRISKVFWKVNHLETTFKLSKNFS